MLAGVVDPRARADALRARLAPLAGSARSELVADGLGLATDGLSDGEPGGRGFALDGRIDNLAKLAVDVGLSPAGGAAAVLRATLARHGERTPERLRGDFVLVAWDMAAESIWLAQDQIGVGAVFWTEQDGQLTFGSEVHHVLALLRRRPSPDDDAILRFLANAETVRGTTLYSGVRRLGAGRRLHSRDGRVECARYHELTYRPPYDDSRLDVAARLRDTLVGAVTSRLDGAKSVGVTLSGGFDSSIVAGAAATAVPAQRLYGYSATFPGDDAMDDRDLLDALIDAYGLTNRRYANDPGGMLATAIEYTSRYSLPLPGPGLVLEMPLLRGARDDRVDVLLDGQGGDETFGPTPYLVGDHLRRGRPDLAVSLIRHRFLGAWRTAPARFTLRALAEYGARPLAPEALRSAVRARRDPHRYAPTTLHEAAARTLARSEDPFVWTRDSTGPLWWLELRHLMTAVREDGGLGDYVRHRSAWFGLRGRPPLFDLELTETALRIPPMMRFDPYLDRPIGREAVAGLVPDAVRLSRRKSNLAPFFFRGLVGPDRPLLGQLLGGDELEIGRWVRRDAIDELLNHPPGVPVSPRAADRWASIIWPLVSAELWLRAEHDPERPSRLQAVALNAREL